MDASKTAQPTSRITDGSKAWNGISYRKRKFPLLSCLKLVSLETPQTSPSTQIQTHNQQKLAKKTTHSSTGERKEPARELN